MAPSYKLPKRTSLAKLKPEDFGVKEKFDICLFLISGQLFVVEKKNITPIDKSASEVMKLIISGGVTEIDEN